MSAEDKKMQQKMNRMMEQIRKNENLLAFADKQYRAKKNELLNQKIQDNMKEQQISLVNQQNI